MKSFQKQKWCAQKKLWMSQENRKNDECHRQTQKKRLSPVCDVCVWKKTWRFPPNIIQKILHKMTTYSFYLIILSAFQFPTRFCFGLFNNILCTNKQTKETSSKKCTQVVQNTLFSFPCMHYIFFWWIFKLFLKPPLWLEFIDIFD